MFWLPSDLWERRRDNDTKMLWKINAFLVSVGVKEEKREKRPGKKDCSRPVRNFKDTCWPAELWWLRQNYNPYESPSLPVR